jgi:hypothetical protein
MVVQLLAVNHCFFLQFKSMTSRVASAGMCFMSIFYTLNKETRSTPVAVHPAKRGTKNGKCVTVMVTFFPPLETRDTLPCPCRRTARSITKPRMHNCRDPICCRIHATRQNCTAAVARGTDFGEGDWEGGGRGQNWYRVEYKWKGSLDPIVRGSTSTR